MSHPIIVTGGAGFIGTNLIRALNQRGFWDILIVDHVETVAKRRNLDLLQFAENQDKAQFRALLRDNAIPHVDAIFHLGACSSTSVMDEQYLEDNTYQYTRELCEWSLRTGTRFIYASSAATYGDGRLGYSDDDNVTKTLEPLNPYGSSKHKFDLWALQTGEISKIVGLK